LHYDSLFNDSALFYAAIKNYDLPKLM